MEKSYKEYLKNIDTFVFDVDGVFTDSTLIITTDGEMLRKMSVKDGYAWKRPSKKDIEFVLFQEVLTKECEVG